MTGRKVMWMTPELIQEMITQGWHIPNEKQASITCFRGLPEGALFVGGAYDANRMHAVGLVFEYADWPATADGDRYPDMEPAAWRVEYAASGDA